MTRYMLSFSHHIGDKGKGRHSPGADMIELAYASVWVF